MQFLYCVRIKLLLFVYSFKQSVLFALYLSSLVLHGAILSIIRNNNSRAIIFTLHIFCSCFSSPRNSRSQGTVPHHPERREREGCVHRRILLPFLIGTGELVFLSCENRDLHAPFSQGIAQKLQLILIKHPTTSFGRVEPPTPWAFF